MLIASGLIKFYNHFKTDVKFTQTALYGSVRTVVWKLGLGTLGPGYPIQAPAEEVVELVCVNCHCYYPFTT